MSTPASTTELRDDYLAALMAGDAIRARHLIDRAVEGGTPLPTIYLDVLQPALEAVGETWEGGEITVAHEHRATAITQGILGALAPRMRIPPTSGRLAVVACTQGELHALGAQMLGDFLEAGGWEVLQLGASVPAGALAELVADESPDVVALSSATVDMLPGVRASLAALTALEPRPFIAIGGRAWRTLPAERALELGADCCLPGPRELARALIERFPPLSDGDAD